MPERGRTGRREQTPTISRRQILLGLGATAAGLTVAGATCGIERFTSPYKRSPENELVSKLTDLDRRLNTPGKLYTEASSIALVALESYCGQNDTQPIDLTNSALFFEQSSELRSKISPP